MPYHNGMAHVMRKAADYPKGPVSSTDISPFQISA
jgi:hypothetical protein